MITLYSTGCPRCKVLESALDAKAMAFPEAYNYVKEMANG